MTETLVMAVSCAETQVTAKRKESTVVRTVEELYVAKIHGFRQGGKRIALRNELMGHEPLVTHIHDGLRDCLVIQLLRLIDFISARITTGVKMADVLQVVLHRANHVAFHDLHVINVVQQFETVRSYFVAERCSPMRAIALVVFVVDFAIQ